MLHATTTLALVLHIAAGAVALVCGCLAALAAKGGRLHRTAGTAFGIAMFAMAIGAAYLGAVVPGQKVNIFIAALTAYLVATAWAAARRRGEGRRWTDPAALCVALLLWAPFAILAVQLATGLPPLFNTAIPFRGAVLIALYSFTAVLTLTVLGDARIVLAGGITGTPRIARHVWRMSLGLALAFGSAFTNGFARLLPGPYHVPLPFFLPQFLPLALLVFWLIRIRLPPWPTRLQQPTNTNITP